MVIAVNTRFLLAEYLEGYGNFIFETVSRIIKAHPEHQFVLLYDRPQSQHLISGSNVQAVVAGPPARHPVLWKLWYDFRIPSVLKKIKADVFVSPDGFCSLTTKLPQCLVLHDLAFIHHPAFIPAMQLRYYRKNTGKFLKKAATIVTVSDFSKQDIISQYNTDPEKITVALIAAKAIFQPLDDTIKQETRNHYTGGKEYFIYTGAVHPRKNLVLLLKAFSIFKKRQQSGMKLLIAGRMAWKNNQFLHLLQTYQHRHDVVLTGYVPDAELVKLTGSAYALLYPSLFEGFGMPVLEAMQCAVPVVTTENSAMQEIGSTAALYTDVKDPASLAEKMMLLYKDENLRNKLAAAGPGRAGQFSWDQTAAQLWQCILKAAGRPQ